MEIKLIIWMVKHQDSIAFNQRQTATRKWLIIGINATYAGNVFAYSLQSGIDAFDRAHLNTILPEKSSKFHRHVFDIINTLIL